MDRLADEQIDHLTKLSREAINSIDAALECFRAEASRAVAQALFAYFKGRLETQAMEVLTKEMNELIEEHGAARIKIRGPQPWIARLSELPEIARLDGKVDAQASDTIDVTVNIDGTHLETTVSDWLVGLERTS